MSHTAQKKDLQSNLSMLIKMTTLASVRVEEEFKNDSITFTKMGITGQTISSII